MSSNTTVTPTRTFTAAALDAELGRRRKNKVRVAKGEEKKRAASFVLPSLSADDMTAIKAGEVIRVEFHSGRVEHVGLKTAD